MDVSKVTQTSEVMPLEENKSINVNLHIDKNEVTHTPELMHLEKDNSGRANPHGVDEIEVAEENSLSEVAQIEASSIGDEEPCVGPAQFLSSASNYLKDAATLLILRSSTLSDVGHLLKQAGSSMIAAGFPYMAAGYSLMAAGFSFIGYDNSEVSTAQICATDLCSADLRVIITNERKTSCHQRIPSSHIRKTGNNHRETSLLQQMTDISQC